MATSQVQRRWRVDRATLELSTTSREQWFVNASAFPDNLPFALHSETIELMVFTGLPAGLLLLLAAASVEDFLCSSNL